MWSIVSSESTVPKAKFVVTLVTLDGKRRRQSCPNTPAGCCELATSPSPLRAQRDLLTTIPGIGEATAAVLIAELF